MSELKQKLNLYGLTMIVVGSCIGAGIFTAPGQISEGIESQAFVLLIWALGGLVALCGALTFSELSGLFPKAGGVYVYLREAYGDLVSFLYGWVILLIITSGAVAFLAELFAEYMSAFAFLDGVNKELMAVMVIVFLTGLNIFGINILQVFANIFSGIKLLTIILIVVCGIWYVNTNDVETFSFTLSNAPENPWKAIFLGLVGVFFSIGGWHQATYVAGEAIKPKQTVPRAMVLGVLIVTVMYLLINWVYMLLLPLPEISATHTVAGDAFSVIFPEWGSQLISLLVAVSVFGAIGIFTVSAPRVYFAMAKDKLFFKQLAQLHPKYKTPVNAMVLQAVISIILILAFEHLYELMAFVTFMDILTMTLAAISIFVFRRTRTNSERPVRVPLYPIVPLIYIVLSSIFVVVTLLQVPRPAWWGMIILLIGFPVYFVFKKRKEKEEILP